MGPAGIAGLLRESVLHRYAQYCNVVRGRLLIDQQKQSVNIQDLPSGGRGRKFIPRRACEPTSRRPILSPRPIIRKIAAHPRQGAATFLLIGRDLEPNQRFSDSRSESRRSSEARSVRRTCQRSWQPNPLTPTSYKKKGRFHQCIRKAA